MVTDATGVLKILTVLLPRRAMATAEMDRSPSRFARSEPARTSWAAAVSLTLQLNEFTETRSPLRVRRVATKSIVSPTATAAALG
jgi:hypothetical protein